MNAAKLIFLHTVLAALALCVVWQSRSVRREGHRLEKIRRQTSRVERQIQRCRAHIGKLKSPQRIMRLVHSLGLNLAHPRAGDEAPAGSGTRTLSELATTADSQPQRN